MRDYKTATRLLDRASAIVEKHGGYTYDDRKSSLEEAKSIIKTRLSEKNNGAFDFATMFRDHLTRRAEGDYRLDAADFIGPIQIKSSPGKGRGLFLTRDVQAGELLLVEKAIAASFKKEAPVEIRRGFNFPFLKPRSRYGMLKHSTLIRLQHAIRWSPSFQLQVLSLFAGEDSQAPKNIPPMRPKSIGSSSMTVMEDEGEDERKFLADVFRLNAFASPPIPQILPSSPSPSISKNTPTKPNALFYLASFLNHSCTPNITRTIIGDVIIVRSRVDMPKGTEIMDAYVTPQTPQARLAFLKSKGLSCRCALCDGDSLDGVDKLGGRALLMGVSGILALFTPILCIVGRALPGSWEPILLLPVRSILETLIRAMEGTYHAQRSALRPEMARLYNDLGNILMVYDAKGAIEAC